LDFRSGDYLGKAVSYNFKVLLREAEILNEVVILLEKHQNDNPALEILRKYGKENAKKVCICLINTRWKSMKRLSST
jgi:hypothetical protein